jgi:cellulose synthase/poly-beta-1,6-N-acetylglucosamine synthase-like glycosyltransferase
MTIYSFLLLFPLAHLVIALLLMRGIARSYTRRTDEPFVSIVVPVRNEEANLASLLDSMLKLDYPVHRMEIILVDDESEDRTKEIALAYTSRFACMYRVIDADHSKEQSLTAKTLPLAQGLDITKGELVLMTDGDCVVPRTWARGMVSYFTEDVGIVCGLTLPDLKKEPGFPMTWFEAVDWSYLLGVCAGFAGLSHPLALIGNNYAVRRSAYEQMGTFRAMDFNYIDDMALQRAALKSGKWRIVFPVDFRSVVRTLPMGGLTSQARQRRRWTKGKDIMDRFGQMMLVFAVITHLSWPLWIVLWGIPGAAAAAIIALGDYLVIGFTLLRARVRPPLMVTLFYPIYTFLYGWLMIFFLLSGKTVQWKARSFSG